MHDAPPFHFGDEFSSFVEHFRCVMEPKCQSSGSIESAEWGRMKEWENLTMVRPKVADDKQHEDACVWSWRRATLYAFDNIYSLAMRNWCMKGHGYACGTAKHTVKDISALSTKLNTFFYNITKCRI